MSDTSGDIDVNRDLWTVVNAQYTDGRALQAWADRDLTWGLFDNREQRLNALGDVTGLDVIELGCGTAFLSASLCEKGARGQSGWT